MRTLLNIWQKEFLQIARNKAILPVLIILPVFQMLILVYAATFDMKNIQLAVVDHDLSGTSRQLTNKFQGSPFFNVKAITFSQTEANTLLEKGEIHAILTFNSHFEKNYIREGYAEVQLLVDAVNGTVAELVQAYSTAIIQDYSVEILPIALQKKIKSPVNISVSYWYNSLLDYKFYMAPGILVILITVIGMILSALNMVREKEMGTIEQINVTPIKKYQFILGKLVPFLIIGIADMAFGLLIARLLFSVPFLGSIGLLLLMTTVYLFTVLSFGLLISTISSTQQQVTFLSFFFIIIFILMSGLFTPVESMPQWAIIVNKINPIYYFVAVIRSILLKNSGFFDLFHPFISLLTYGIVLLSLAIYRYRKTV